jgi:hypothetical protein
MRRTLRPSAMMVAAAVLVVLTAAPLGLSETVSQDDDIQAWDLPKATPLACGHAIAQGNGRGTEEIMGSDAWLFEARPAPSAAWIRGPKVERKHRKHGEAPLDKSFTALTLRD